MSEKDELPEKFRVFCHDLFIVKSYESWRSSLHGQEFDRWYSLIVELDKLGLPIDVLKDFGRDVYSNFVYRCVPSPSFKRTSEIMVLFNVSGCIWTSLVHHTPSNNEIVKAKN